MSYNVTTLLHDVTDSVTNANLEDPEAKRCGFLNHSSWENPYGYDCSSSKLKVDGERNITPGFPMPHWPWMNRQPFPPMSSHLAPRSEYEQQYWYRPSYFGWQHFTSASQVTSHQSTFLKLQNTSPPSPPGVQLMQCHTTRYQTTGCHGTEYTGYTGYHARGYEATSGCHATGYETNQFQAIGYQTRDSENRLAHNLGGLAYDHGEFPKILSVHSMSERNETGQTYYAGQSHFANTITNVACPVPVTGSSPSAENSTGANKPPECEIYDKENHRENDCSDHLSSSSLENNLAKTGCEIAVGNKANTNYSISTILSCERQNDSETNQIEDVSHLRIPVCDTDRRETKNSELSCPGYEEEKEWSNVTSKEEFKWADTAGKKPEMCNNGAKTTKLAESSTNPVPESDKLNEPTTSASKARKLSSHEQMAQIKKKMIQERIQKLKYIQTSFKVFKKPQSGRSILLKKMAILKKEIEYLANGKSFAVSPLNSTPVKKSSSTPNKEMKRSGKAAEEPSRIQENCSTAAVEDSCSVEGMEGKFSEREMERMNVFEKLGLLHGQNRLSYETYNSASCDGPEKNSLELHVEECGKNVSEVATQMEDEGCSPQLTVVYSKDIKETKGQILVNSAASSNAGETEYKLNTRDEYLPNSWSSAYVFENQSRQKESFDSLKRNITDDQVLYKDTAAKRRCKTLPRKVVASARSIDFGRAFDTDVFCDETLFQKQESEGCAEGWKNSPTAFKLSDDTGSNASRVETVEDGGNSSNNDNGKVVGSHKGTKTGTEFVIPRVYDDDTLQREHEIRETKISDLIRKQEGLLQALKKMASKAHAEGELNCIP